MSFLTRAKALFTGEPNTTASYSGGIFVNGEFQSDKKLSVQAEFSWAFVAMNAIAKEIATTPLRLYKKVGDNQEEVLKHDALDALQKPNEAQTDYDILWTTTMHQNAIGETVWVFEDDNTFSAFSTDSATVTYSDTGEIESIKLLDGKQGEYDGDHAIVFKQPSLVSPLTGKGTLSAISHTVDLDTYLEDHLRIFFLNNATPQGFFSPKNKDGITSDFRKRMIVALNNRHKGTSKAHKFGILEKPMDWIQTGVSLTDQHLQQTSEIIRKKILATFGVPEAVLGITDGVRANSDVADKVFARRTIRPQLILLEKQLNRYFLSRFDGVENMFFQFDEVVKEDEKLNAEINQIYITAGVKTADEVREELGLEALDVEPEESTEEKLAKIIAHRKQIKEDAKPKVKMVYSDEEVTEYHEKKLSFTDEQETLLKAELEVYFEKQSKRVMRSIKNRKANSENVEYDELSEKEIDTLEALLTGYALDVIVFQSRNTNALMGLVDQITKKDEEAVKFATERSHKSAESIVKNIQPRIDKVILKAENSTEAKEAVSALYSKEIIKNKPTQVAITEVSTSAGWASVSTYKRLEQVPAGKRWITTGNERVCQYCSPMDNVIIPLEGKFWNANERMVGLEGGTLDFKFSGGVDVYPMHSNCKCSLVPVFNEGLIPEKPFSYKDDFKKNAIIMDREQELEKAKKELDERETKINEDADANDCKFNALLEGNKKLEETKNKLDDDVDKIHNLISDL